MNSGDVTQLHVLSESGRKRKAGREVWWKGRKIETGREGGGRREQWICVGGGGGAGGREREREGVDLPLTQEARNWKREKRRKRNNEEGRE